jgi:hypothetical protein
MSRTAGTPKRWSAKSAAGKPLSSAACPITGDALADARQDALINPAVVELRACAG